MGISAEKMGRALRFAGEVVAETLWPTRCALCDAPGKVLCDACAAHLPFLDWWRACPHCGAAFGRVQCHVCNPVTLAHIGRERLPFTSCASAVDYSAETGQLVRVYKDHGERRLAAELARFMVRVVDPCWRFDALTYIPATKAAFRRRGFDHGELLVKELSAQLGREYVCALDRPTTRDQRTLGGADRIANLQGGFRSFSDAIAGKRLLLVDDVLTTGSTLCAATDALMQAGVQEVFCITFARV